MYHGLSHQLKKFLHTSSIFICRIYSDRCIIQPLYGSLFLVSNLPCYKVRRVILLFTLAYGLPATIKFRINCIIFFLYIFLFLLSCALCSKEFTWFLAQCRCFNKVGWYLKRCNLNICATVRE